MAAQTSSSPGIQEYVVRVPKNVKKSYHVMRFNSSLGVDFTKWTGVKMERQNNLKEFKGTEEEIPKFGAGSEFGREAREEARRKKYGIIAKKYSAEAQPWLLKVGGKTGKRFQGLREGGIAENASYYVFTQFSDGVFEAFPVEEWYNFHSVNRYKTLTAEEAEDEFGRRNKILNYFSVMLRKRMRNEDDPDAEEGPEDGSGKTKGTKGKYGKGNKSLKISDMDEWAQSSEGEDDEDEKEEMDDEDDDNKTKKSAEGKKNQKKKKKKKKKTDSDDEAFEDSDDGDEEGREVEYMSETSSESGEDLDEKTKDMMKGVDEEDGIRKILNSDEDEDESEAEKKEEEDETENVDKEETTEEVKDKKEKKKKKKQKEEKKKAVKNEKEESDSSSITSISDSEDEQQKKEQEKGSKKGKESHSSSANSSRATTPIKALDQEAKRKLVQDVLNAPPMKKFKLENFGSLGSSSSAPVDSTITEEGVRRYLTRKPMTTTELLQKFKSKKTGLTSEQLVNVIAQILKIINPVKQIIKGKMYLSLKS